MTEKKVVLVVVEGPSEEAALGSIFKEYFSNDFVRFHVVHGDITTQDYISSDKIVEKICDQIHILQLRYGYDQTDYLKIIHLTDTDGVFISDRLVIENAELKPLKKVRYYEDHIETHSSSSTIDRNKRKGEVLIKLRSVNKIMDIPYKIYYNSCNLEHVLRGTLEDFSDEEKEEFADEFAERYENNVEEFIKFINGDDIAVPGTYMETWKYIWKANSVNSLNRHSNMHLIFQKPKEF